MIETIVDWVGPLYAGSIGYMLIFAIIFLDRAAFTGIFVPGELFVALGGIYAGREKLSVVLVIAVAAAAGILGETVSFWLGRRYGIRIIRHLPLANRFAKHLDSARDYFRRGGGWTVFVGRYVSVLGTFLPFVAGMSRMPVVRFLVFDVAAIGLWATGVVLLGYFLNAQIQLVDKILSEFGWALLALIVMFVLARFALRRRDRIRRWVAEKKPS